MDNEIHEIHNTDQIRKGLKPGRKFWPYFTVGLVCAIIGALITAVLVPQIIIGRMEALKLSAPSSTSGPGGETSNLVSTKYVPSSDPWQVIVDAAEAVSPAVVGIVNSHSVYDFFGREYLRDSSGSGVIITSDGYIVTNNHVVSGDSRKIVVALADGRTLNAKIVGTDPATDLAVIKIDDTDLPTAAFGDSDNLKPGQLAIAIGNPLGMEFSRSVTAGVISGLNRVLLIGDQYMRLIQTDAVINPGNSGGPLINGNAQVIGLNSAKLDVPAVEGMGFAIPSKQVKRIVEEIIQTGKVRRAFAGVSLMERTEARLYVPDADITQGIYVYEVVRGGPADKGGIKSGDAVVEFDGHAINDLGTFMALISEKSPGDKVQVKVFREGQKLEFEIELIEAPTQAR